MVTPKRLTALLELRLNLLAKQTNISCFSCPFEYLENMQFLTTQNLWLENKYIDTLF